MLYVLYFIIIQYFYYTVPQWHKYNNTGNASVLPVLGHEDEVKGLSEYLLFFCH